jgi:hypothetical protein
MAQQKINTVIVLRNDQTTAWEKSSYKMLPGEVGIGYLENGNIIAKVGNGKDTWTDLPQLEGVFEDNLTLTYKFGKYEPDTTGSFVLNTAGKTMSEVMLDAFAQEVYEGLIETVPTASFSVSSNGSKEVGETFSNPTATLTLNASGTYKYKSKDSNGTVEQADISFTEAHISYDSSKVKELDSTNPNASLSYTLSLADSEKVYGDSAKSYTFKATAKHGADVNRPLTNLGNFVSKDAGGNYVGTKDFSKAIGAIAGATLLNASSKTVTHTGYRKMFMGTVSADPETVNSAFIRGLNKISKQAAKGAQTFTASAGQKSFYVAVPISLTTKEPTFKYKFFGNWEALAGVVALDGTVDVEGANKFTAKPYKVYKYTPATGSFEADTEIQVTIN